MTRQTLRMLRIFRDHFGVDECRVLIKREPRVEFLRGATAPARVLARRGTISCDHMTDKNINKKVVRTTVPKRITARRATHNVGRSVTQISRSVPELIPLPSSSTNSSTGTRYFFIFIYV